MKPGLPPESQFAVIRWESEAIGIYPVTGPDDLFIKNSKGIRCLDIYPTLAEAKQVRSDELISRMVLEM